MTENNDERAGDYLEQHHVIDTPRLDDAEIDGRISIRVQDGVDIVTLELTDGAMNRLKDN